MVYLKRGIRLLDYKIVLHLKVYSVISINLFVCLLNVYANKSIVREI